MGVVEPWMLQDFPARNTIRGTEAILRRFIGDVGDTRGVGDGRGMSGCHVAAILCLLLLFTQKATSDKGHEKNDFCMYLCLEFRGDSESW